MKIKIKKLKKNAIIPTRGSIYSAGYDLYACIDGCESMGPLSTMKIPTGIAMEIPHGYFGAVFPRSGLATNQGLRLANCVAVIDEDYRGEWFVPLHNDDPFYGKIIHNGDRIAQVVLLPYFTMDFEEVKELEETERGINGFGSTGV